MKLQQLRYVVETYRRNLNVSEAAEALFTSQPGVSKQIRLLEDELGVQIFIRSGKRIAAVTQAGQAVLEIAEQILHNVNKIKTISSEFANEDTGSLSIAATPTIARFVLPEIIRSFVQHNPDIELNVRQGSPEAVHDMVLHGEVDFAISNQMVGNSPDLRRLLGKPWQYALVLPQDVSLPENVSWADIVSQPLITYEYAMSPQAWLGKALIKAGQDDVRIAFASNDNDVLLEYVRLGMGVGVVDKLAVQACSDFQVVDISHLFEPTHLQIVLRPDNLLRGCAYDLIELLQPELNRDNIERLIYSPALQDFSI